MTSGDEDADAVAVDAAGDEQEAAARAPPSTTALGELGLGLLRGRVGDELDRQHRAEAAHVADRGPALLPGEHARADRLAEPRRALDEALLVDHVEHGERRRLRDRVADVGAADAARTGASMISARPSTPESGRPIGDRLRDADQVGLDAEVLAWRRSGRCGRSPSAPRRRRARCRAGRRCARRPCDELGRRDDEAALALHGLEHDRGDVSAARPAP